MADPYETMGLTRSSSDAEIRRRYLDLVRQFPPERDAERFAAIRHAYDQLRDPVLRLGRRVFEIEQGDSWESVQADWGRRLRAARIPVDVLLALAEGP
jgi:curved DNA-binding protein CbpA